MCCPISMPVGAGTPAASPDNPLLGVYISLDTRVMTERAIEMEKQGPADYVYTLPPLPTSCPGFSL